MAALIAGIGFGLSKASPKFRRNFFLTLGAIFLLCTVGQYVVGLLLLARSVFLYLLPTFIALKREQPNKMAIFVLNLCLGWTLVGWVGALVWACTKEQRAVVIQNPPAPNAPAPTFRVV